MASVGRRPLVGLGLAAALVAGCTSSAPPAPRPSLSADLVGGPNVLVILTDDQHPTGTIDVMPETRRLFQREGTSFRHAFLTTPLCCPSRGSILSGRYAHNHGVLNNRRAENLDQAATMERYLHDSGYTTAIYGKFLNRWPLDRDPPSFDRWGIFSPPFSSSEYVNPTFNLQGRTSHSVGYATDTISAQAERFLVRQERDDRRPWFLYLAPSAPHRPFTPAPRDVDAPVPGWPGNPATAERDVSDKPPYVRALQAASGPTTDIIREQQRTLLSVDRLVDGVFSALRDLDEDRDTLAFFLTDNGYEWGEHGLRDIKNVPYTESITTPLFVRWPGHVRAGAVDNRMAANVDIAPTILQAAGIHPTRLLYELDGRSLLTPIERDRILIEYWVDPGTHVPNWASTRTRDSQYVETYAPDASTVVFREFYDLQSDPFELENLLGDDDPSNDPNTAALSAQLRRDRSCSGAGCP